MWNLSEAVLGNMKRREQLFVLDDNVSQPPLALRSEVWVAQWQNTQGPGCSGPMHLGAKLDHTLEQPLNSVAMGILYVATELDEGIHFSSAVCLDRRSFEVAKAARVRDPSLKSNPQANSREFLIKNLWLRRCIRLCNLRHNRRPKVPYNEAPLFEESLKPKAVFLMRAMARG